MKVDATKILSIVSMALSIGATLLSNHVSDKKNKELITQLVKDELTQK